MDIALLPELFDALSGISSHGVLVLVILFEFAIIVQQERRYEAFRMRQDEKIFRLIDVNAVQNDAIKDLANEINTLARHTEQLVRTTPYR